MLSFFCRCKVMWTTPLPREPQSLSEAANPTSQSPTTRSVHPCIMLAF